MKISIKTNAEDRAAILSVAMEAITGAASGETRWEEDGRYGRHETECPVSVETVLPVLRALVEKYPQLDIFALDVEEIRDDDASAQWWRSTKITTARRPDGTSELKIDSGTYWN